MLAGKKTLVIGLGKTGLAAASFLLDQGAKVAATDIMAREQINKTLQPLKDKAALIALSDYNERALAGVDLVIPSPGVPPADDILVAAQKAGIPIMSELELAFKYLTRPLLAITGTNGKTTTVTLLGEILEKCGRSVFVGGNIGAPLIGYVAGPQDEDYVVAEVSSFQLQWIETFRPKVAALLNISGDHLDYHGSFAAYRQSKERIFENQKEGDLAIMNAGEDWAESLASRLVCRKMFFSTQIPGVTGIFLQGNRLIYEDNEGVREDYPRDMIVIPGQHNIENVMAAILAARECGCPREGIIAAVRSFHGIAHRIEYAGRKGNVLFYDDSKGTNVGAVQRALETFDRPIILLMGGRDKDSDFSKLAPFIPGRVKRLITFGEAGPKIAAALESSVKTSMARGLREAVVLACRHSAAGDVILLSPGCASFDEFSNYAERGRVFKDVIKNL